MGLGFIYVHFGYPKQITRFSLLKILPKKMCALRFSSLRATRYRTMGEAEETEETHDAESPAAASEKTTTTTTTTATTT